MKQWKTCDYILKKQGFHGQSSAIVTHFRKGFLKGTRWSPGKRPAPAHGVQGCWTEQDRATYSTRPNFDFRTIFPIFSNKKEDGEIYPFKTALKGTSGKASSEKDALAPQGRTSRGNCVEKSPAPKLTVHVGQSLSFCMTLPLKHSTWPSSALLFVSPCQSIAA